ncbi:Arginyl-tRNA synthetase [Rhizophlyctis rosea]|uniref:Arginyl-tRNA synthetase n=1 Tax=Rhizophlyctis rosea TaxID=64517 RepID=A0AAD5WZU4_9FUNG|nr:Arginyl-tRNA synthetase [Rhizophlyctis rosea]
MPRWTHYGSVEELMSNPLQHLCDISKKAQQHSITQNGMEEAMDYLHKLHIGDTLVTSTWKTLFAAYRAELAKLFNRIGVTLDITSNELPFGRQDLTTPIHSEILTHFLSTSEDRLDLSSSNLGTPRLHRTVASPKPLLVDLTSTLSNLKTYSRVIRIAPEKQQFTYAQHNHIVSKILSSRPTPTLLPKMETLLIAPVTDLTPLDGVLSLHTIFDQSKQHMLKFARDPNADEDTSKSETFDPVETADKLGVNAITFQILQSKRNKLLKFEWKRVMSDVRDPGVFVSYLYARLCGCVLFLSSSLSMI